MNVKWGTWRLRDGISRFKFMVGDMYRQLDQLDWSSQQQYLPIIEDTIDKKWQELLNDKEIV